MFCGLSVCLSCIVLKWQNISTRFHLHTTAPCVSQIVLKYGLHSSTHSFQILPQIDPLSILSVGDIRWQIVAEWLDIAQWSQWRAYRKPPSLFRTVPSLTPTPQKAEKEMHPRMHPQGQLRDACCHLANMIEDIDKISFAYDIISRAMFPFAKLLWPLFNTTPKLDMGPNYWPNPTRPNAKLHFMIRPI